MQTAIFLVVCSARCWRRRTCSPGTCTASTRGARRVPRPRARPTRAPHLPPLAASTPSGRCAGPSTRAACSFFSAVSVLAALPAPAPPGHAAAQPGRSGGRPAGHRVQHGRVVRDQHELAELHARADDVVPDADGRAWRCRTSSRRPSAWRSPSRWCAASRARAPATHRQLLGRPHARHALRAAAARARARDRARLAGRRPDLRRAREHVQTVEGATQTIAVGPAASQIAIKQLGTNGGGFFNANSAHPFESGTPFSNFLEHWSLLLIPFALPVPVRPHARRTRGRARDPRGDARPARRRRRRRADGRDAHDARPDGRRPRRRPEHGGQGAALRQCRRRRCSPSRPPATSTGAVNSMHDSLHRRRRLARADR